MRLHISIQKWADFDIPYDAIVLYSDEHLDKDALVKEFMNKMSIANYSYENGHIGNLQYVEKEGYNFNYGSGLNQLADEFIKFLRHKGFKRLKSERISFSD